MPPIRMKGDGRKAKNPKKTLLRLFSYLRPYRVTMIFVIICIAIPNYRSRSIRQRHSYRSGCRRWVWSFDL